MADVTGGFEVGVGSGQRLSERRCEVCGAPADLEQTSAHLARVHFFCTDDGQAFHASAYFQVARLASSTAECWVAVEAWLDVAKADAAARGVTS